MSLLSEIYKTLVLQISTLMQCATTLDHPVVVWFWALLTTGCLSCRVYVSVSTCSCIMAFLWLLHMEHLMATVNQCNSVAVVVRQHGLARQLHHLFFLFFFYDLQCWNQQGVSEDNLHCVGGYVTYPFVHHLFGVFLLSCHLLCQVQ